jgi:uncharacterized protein
LHTGPTNKKYMPKEPGFINGGMFARGGDFAAKGVVITPVVKDIKASLEKVKANGGNVIAERQPSQKWAFTPIFKIRKAMLSASGKN